MDKDKTNAKPSAQPVENKPKSLLDKLLQLDLNDIQRLFAIFMVAVTMLYIGKVLIQLLFG